MSVTRSQLLSAKKEVEASIIAAKELKNQIFDQSGQLDLSKKDFNYNQRAFKNRLLTAKWDCEDLEELLSTTTLGSIELTELRIFGESTRREIASLSNQLEEAESRLKTFQKHGIQDYTDTKLSTTNSDYRLEYSPVSEKQLASLDSDKSQSTVSANVFNNALYDHLENDTRLGFETTKVFNNLERPTTDVYISPNENELILEMLDTGHSSQSTNSKLKSTALKKVFDTTGSKFVGLIVCIIIIFFIM